MKIKPIVFLLISLFFCRAIFAQQTILDEFVPGVKWGMTANELAENRPSIFTENGSGARNGETAPKSEQLDGNPMVSVQYQFGWPDTLGLIGVNFICLDRETALATARKFVPSDLENNNTYFWKMDDGSSVTLSISEEKINLSWYPVRGRRKK